MMRSIRLLTLSALMATGQLASADVVSPLPIGGDERDNLVPVEETYTDRRAHAGGSIVSWGMSKDRQRSETSSSTNPF